MYEHEVRCTMLEFDSANRRTELDLKLLIIGRTLFALIRTSCIGPRTSKSEVECESG